MNGNATNKIEEYKNFGEAKQHSTPVKPKAEHPKHTPEKLLDIQKWPYEPQGVDKNIKEGFYNMAVLKNLHTTKSTYIYYNRRGLSRPTAHFIIEGNEIPPFEETLADKVLYKYMLNYPKEDFGDFTIITKSYKRADFLAIDFMKLAWEHVMRNHNNKLNNDQAIHYMVSIRTAYGRHFYKKDVLGIKLTMKEIDESFILNIIETPPSSPEHALQLFFENM